MTRQTATSQTFLLSKPGRKHSVRCFAPLQPEHVSSRQRVHEVVAQANSHSLWISDDKPLTDTLLNALASRTGSLGAMILLYQPTLASIPVLLRYFYRVVFGREKDLLPPEELAEVLAAPNKADLFIGGIVDDDSKTLTLWRGDLTTLTVPFTAFPTSGDGITPDFAAFTVIDCGHTVRLGAYEAATEALLYEYDPLYRRRIARERRKEDRSFGAALRRLRKQRGVRRADFAPLSAKTIARIEQGKVDPDHLRPSTLSIIAKRLAVEPGDIKTY
jgi:DNA-binding Xre family transcriptional regulator